jgi:streptomycin 6-kinase
MIAVPEDFASAAATRGGEAGRKWVATLPGLVEALCEQWDLIVDGPVLHGYLGLVIPVIRAGEACALKVTWIDVSTADEAAALLAWDGRGAVRLLEMQPSLGAILLERLDHTRTLAAVDIEEAVGIAGRLLRRLAIPAPHGFRPLRAVAGELSQALPERWQRYGRPMSRRLLERACDLAVQLGPSSGRLMVNYDLHYENVLAGGREPWLAVDPKVVAGDVEFGVAQLLWRRLEDMGAQGGLDRHFRILSEVAELDPDRARAWTMVRCVDYWLWGISVGLTDDPARCRIIADWLSRG